MTEDLPSIAALRAFATAAQTLSFKEAAARLHVSASALSRQVQGLEEHLGTALFIRANPGIELTPTGLEYLVTVERLLRELKAAGVALAAKPAGPLRISALESFCAQWLVPHLPEFSAAHPEIDIQLEATLRYADFDRDAVDAAIRFGTGPWGDLHSEPVVNLEFFPVCSPGLRDGDSPIREPQDLAAHVWIHVSQVPDAWRDWARKSGHPNLRGKRNLEFDHVGIAMSAAESGQGVALSSDLLCATEISDGRLCIPIDTRVESAETYHLVCRPEGLVDPRIVAFRDWLVSTLN